MSIQESVLSIQKDFNKNVYNKFIHEITLSKYKNFTPASKIKFAFPITAIVGPNGGGKSSILHALWGMCADHSTSRFWFSTPVDDIVDIDQNRFWYKHFIKEINVFAQSRKSAGKKRFGYWEPTRPAKSDGMEGMPPKTNLNSAFMSDSGDRWNQVNKKPHYINSKTQTSAFDRFFYNSSSSSLTSKQQFFIKYSKPLKKTINGNLQNYRYYGVNRVFSNFLLQKNELEAVNSILQKKYISARYVLHSFYETPPSVSVIFETKNQTYSESFAGSGELAIVNLILSLRTVSEFDMLLLDEPETSLHPGAQKRLLEHLLKITKEKKLQVVISTHSPTFVELLPPEALVVLNDSWEGTSIRENPSKAYAFHSIGQIEKEKITILTEDSLLKAFVEVAVKKLPIELNKKINIESAFVGASEMLSNQVKAYIQTNDNVLMVVDGDQKSALNLVNVSLEEISVSEKKEIAQTLKNDHKISILGTSHFEESSFNAWVTWVCNRTIPIEYLCPEEIFLLLLNPNHKLHEDPSKKNSNFKDALRKEIYQRLSHTDSSQLYALFKWELNKLDNLTNPKIQSEIDRLSSEIQSKIEKMFK